MNFKGAAIFLTTIVLLGMNDTAQDLSASVTESNNDGQAPSFSTSHFKFGDTKEALTTLQETVAANDSILAKQKESLAQIVELKERAQGAKSAAKKSLSRKKNSPTPPPH